MPGYKVVGLTSYREVGHPKLYGRQPGRARRWQVKPSYKVAGLAKLQGG